ncbi:acyl-CoA carboxylase epsilon subunit [Nonomuraea rosea]|uniref:acyl-CoA carboxylase epsilon subunit n=1 Tax=Nonomuraea rosea TaxID=638574 RepID=UPI0031EA2F5D
MVKGAPAPEELAALVVALHTARTAPAPSPVARRPLLRRPLLAGPGAWRESRWNLGGHL